MRTASLAPGRVWLRSRRSLTAMALGMMGLGVAARLYLFLARPSFWGDELLLIPNILRRGFADLLLPLDHGQIAPVLFLELEKLATSIFGISELSARILPLLLGIAAIGLAALAVRQIASREAAVWAAVMASASPSLLQYSNEAKQYSVESAASAALLAVCLWRLRQKFTYGGLLALSGTAVAALLLSVPAIFVVESAWAAVWVHCRAQKAPLKLQAGVVAAALASAGVFAGLYAHTYALNGRSVYMRHFWAPAYIAAQRSAGAGAVFAIQALAHPLFTPDDRLPVYVTVLAVALAAAGLIRLAAAREATILLAGPLVLMLGANLAGQWPLAPRLTTFAIPVFLVVMSKGMEPWLVGRRALAGGLFTLVLMGPSLRKDVWQVRHPSGAEDCREMVKSLLQRVTPEDAVYVYAGGAPAWLFYSVNWAAPDWARIQAWEEASKQLGDNPGNAPPRGAPARNEGGGLIFNVDGHLELMGLASGSQSDGSGYHGKPPDPGWAGNEAERIASCGRRRGFVFVSQYRQPVIEPLEEELERRGMRLIEKHEGISRWYLFQREAPGEQ